MAVNTPWTMDEILDLLYLIRNLPETNAPTDAYDGGTASADDAASD